MIISPGRAKKEPSRLQVIRVCSANFGHAAFENPNERNPRSPLYAWVPGLKAPNLKLRSMNISPGHAKREPSRLQVIRVSGLCVAGQVPTHTVELAGFVLSDFCDQSCTT